MKLTYSRPLEASRLALISLLLLQNPMVRGKDRFRDRWSFNVPSTENADPIKDTTEEDDRQLIKSIGEKEYPLYLQAIPSISLTYTNALCFSMERLYIPPISNGSILRDKLHRS